MSDTLKLNQLDAGFAQAIEQASGQQLSLCYQCGKCTAGCPIAGSGEAPPHKIMYMAQLGLKERVLSSPAIWLCVSCATCTARCPKGVDLAEIMNSLRELAVREGFAAKEPRIKLLERLLLDSVKRHGRVHDLGMLIRFNLYSLQPFKDMSLVPPLWQRGKLGMIPKGVKGIAEIQRIFRKYQNKEK